MTLSALDSLILGPLFATDAMRAVFTDEARIAAMLRAEAALARAQGRAGLVPDALAPALDALAPAALDPTSLGRRTALSGVPVIPFVKAVQATLPADLEPAFHKGTTTQDIADTALALQLREAFGLVAEDLGAILAGLSDLARRHRETPCVGRTYGQHAAPVTFGFKAAIWALGIAEVAADLPRIRGRALAASLGGPVGTLASLGEAADAVGEDFARVLGLGYEPAPWHTRRARIAETGSWLALLMGTLAKLATDVAHLASTEVGEVAEPFVPGRGGSSAMPHKRNPVSSTVILAAFSAAKGQVVPLLDGMAAAHERPAGAWHAEWHALPALFGLASGALREARALAEGLVPDPARMRTNLDLTGGLLFADALAARLAPRLGAEAAHALVEAAAGAVREGRGSLAAVLAARPEAAGIDLQPAFDLAPAIRAGARTTDRALAETARLAALLTRPSHPDASPCP
ncbi:lyase family protein [Methylobacterium oryzisoli]|uniref:lyase family protein n=1 Tax=Methylobacterium oryzisoli TaxID=3385502 RepID=UPI003891DC16